MSASPFRLRNCKSRCECNALKCLTITNLFCVCNESYKFRVNLYHKMRCERRLLGLRGKSWDLHICWTGGPAAFNAINCSWRGNSYTLQVTRLFGLTQIYSSLINLLPGWRENTAKHFERIVRRDTWKWCFWCLRTLLFGLRRSLRLLEVKLPRVFGGLQWLWNLLYRRSSRCPISVSLLQTRNLRTSKYNRTWLSKGTSFGFGFRRSMIHISIRRPFFPADIFLVLLSPCCKVLQ